MITTTGYDELKDVMAYLEQAPFDVTRKSLYSPAELYEGFCPDDESSYGACFDYKVYQHYSSLGQHARNVKELLGRALHDHCIHAALARFFKEYDHRRCVGIMGGHALLRTDKMYRDIALLSQRLTRQGFVMISGGGPGAMEATHLGAWLAREGIRLARELGKRVIHLDVVPGNLAASRIYEAEGFAFACTHEVFYEDTGLMGFDLYEYVL